MTENLKIMTWNSNGLQNYYQEQHAVLDTENIDIYLVTETHIYIYLRITHNAYLYHRKS